MGTSSNKPTSLLLNSLKQPECIEVWRILVWKFKNYSAKSCKILYKFSSLRIFEDLGYTPELTAGSPKHHPIEKENHLPSTSMTLGFQSLIFQGVCLRLSFYFLPCDSSPYHYRSTLATWLPGTHHSPGRESHFTLNSPTSPPKFGSQQQLNNFQIGTSFFSSSLCVPWKRHLLKKITMTLLFLEHRFLENKNHFP